MRSLSLLIFQTDPTTSVSVDLTPSRRGVAALSATGRSGLSAIVYAIPVFLAVIAAEYVIGERAGLSSRARTDRILRAAADAAGSERRRHDLARRER